jgi:hypothetical protein
MNSCTASDDAAREKLGQKMLMSDVLRLYDSVWSLSTASVFCSHYSLVMEIY